MTALDITPLDTSQLSTTDQVFEALYHAVISVKLPPGSKVSEIEIAKQLGVSRQPVRDAFFRLSNLGFLSIRPQRATLITTISLKAVSDAVFTRIALETECLRTAMERNQAELVAALEENLSLQKSTLDAPLAAFHALDDAFHEVICTIAGHAHVWTLIKDQKGHLDRIRHLTLSQERRTLAINEHAAILGSISAGDVGRAEAELRRHIEGVQSVAVAMQDQHPTYFESTE